MIPWSAFKVVGREQEYLNTAFESGWVSGGQFVERLEQALAGMFPGAAALAVSNGTAALQLAFQILGVRPGDQVIVPSFCFQAAGNVLRQLGAEPVFCDVDALSWNQTVPAIEAAVTTRTVGVVVVHNYGVAAPVAAIRNWCDRVGLWLIEDCAEAWFSRHAGQLLGVFGDVSTFSMHATKTISCGEGGAVLVNRPALVERARLLRSHGLDRSRVQYLHSCAGNNYRLSNLLAAVALAQLERYADILEAQRRIEELYRTGLEGHWAIDLQWRDSSGQDLLWATAASIRFDCLGIDRDRMLGLLREAGIEARPGFYPASLLTYNSERKLIHSDVADRIHGSLIVLPCALSLTAEQIEYICRMLRDLIDEHARADRRFGLHRAAEVADGVARVRDFYERLQSGRRTFRYFERRSYAVIGSHLCTWLLDVAGRTVGYGHLDPEGDDVWLGIAVADDEVGKGWGRILMRALIAEAARLGISRLVLRVDRDNPAAIALYRSFGFRARSASDDGSPALDMVLQR